MKKWILCAAMFVVLGGMVGQGQSHVAEPAVNLGDTSFLDGIAGPGFSWSRLVDVAHDGKIVDSTGKTVPGSGSVNGISGLTHVAWLAHQRILRGGTGWKLSAQQRM